jgi:rsbT co-antagonist protein RsbR
MGVTPEEVAERKAFLEFDDRDVGHLQELTGLAQQYAVPVIEAFYRHLLSFPVGQEFFEDRALLERVKQAQVRYFLDLTTGDYGPDYVENRLRIGAVHERIGLPVDADLGMYNFYLRDVSKRLFEAWRDKPERVLTAIQSLLKLVFLDIGLALDTYIDHRERTIRLQQRAISDLPTPVLQLREGLLLVPIVGLIDSSRARQLTEQLLQAIRANRAKVVVLDITGVQAVDTKVANHLVQTMEASRLMGANVIVSGLSPEVAQTLVVLGIDLGNVRTVGDLQVAIDEADRFLGYQADRSGVARQPES